MEELIVEIPKGAHYKGAKWHRTLCFYYQFDLLRDFDLIQAHKPKQTFLKTKAEKVKKQNSSLSPYHTSNLQEISQIIYAMPAGNRSTADSFRQFKTLKTQ